jgi:hypothetical protein
MLRLTESSNFLSLRTDINLRRQSITGRCISELSDAFAYDYHIDNIMEFTSHRLQWRGRLAWTDLKTNHRWTCNIGDFLLVQRRRRRNGPVDVKVIRLAQLFAYCFLGTPYLFAVGNVVEQVYEEAGNEMENPVLGLDVWKVRHKQVIYGLPAIDNQALYFVQCQARRMDLGEAWMWIMRNWFFRVGETLTFCNGFSREAAAVCNEYKDYCHFQPTNGVMYIVYEVHASEVHGFKPVR